jgi:hypothetical protein
VNATIAAAMVACQFELDNFMILLDERELLRLEMSHLAKRLLPLTVITLNPNRPT